MTYVQWYDKDRKQNWGTPFELFNSLNDRYHFDLDGASDGGNGLLPEVSTPSDPVPWAGRRVFCNPPWSVIPPFVEQAAQAELAVLLVPARTNSRWFHRALALGARVEFFVGRPKFRHPEEGKEPISSSPVDCVFLVFGK